MDARFASAPRRDLLYLGNRPGNRRMLARLGIGVVGSVQSSLRSPYPILGDIDTAVSLHRMAKSSNHVLESQFSIVFHRVK